MKLVLTILILGIVCACQVQSCTPEDTEKCKNEWFKAAAACSVRKNPKKLNFVKFRITRISNLANSRNLDEEEDTM